MGSADDTRLFAREMADSIAALPPLPATAHEILRSFGDEFIDADKVAEVVESDPAISGKLLGLANSAYFGLAEPVTNIRDAIVRVIGVETVRSLVLAMALQRSFNRKNCPSFDAKRFWLQSLLAAECCKRVALADGLATGTVRDLSYSAGLCHNLGMLALVHMEPYRTNTVLQAHRKHPQPGNLSKLFVAEFGSDHKMITAELARLWSLPGPMVGAYHFRAAVDSTCENRLGPILAATVAAVGNTEVEADQRTDLCCWADNFGLTANDLQRIALPGDRHKDKLQTLANNMAD